MLIWILLFIAGPLTMCLFSMFHSINLHHFLPIPFNQRRSNLLFLLPRQSEKRDVSLVVVYRDILIRSGRRQFQKR
ncbi:hypothetical protein F4811DRAFT_538240 [Daldinia bambusicola]|nr:hypothetical protein F4811DRAFT_538240 [Daldinia bambusicola]